MKNYILTERQIKEIVDQPMIKKGIALKISDDKGEYYKSVLKEFVDEEEYNDWKDNLDETMSVIGEMDIEEESDVLKEEKSKIDPKKKGFELITNLVKKKFPFIKKINVEYKPKSEIRDIPILIEFDLAEFYEYSKTKPPWRPWLKTIDDKIDSMDENQSYLMLFIDHYLEFDRQKYGWEFSKKILDIINNYYKRLPKWMTHTYFEGMSNQELIDLAIERNRPDTDWGRDFYIRWRDEEEPIQFDIKSFVPIINKEKLRKYYEK
jgi:hypothetical protein